MKTNNLALRPNCLLTKYPLVFLTGIRSLFYYEKLGGSLQDFIAAHGYVVFSPPLPFRSKSQRNISLRHWLKQQQEKRFHFVLSENTLAEFRELLKDFPDSTFSLTSKNLSKEPRRQGETLSYKLHRAYCSFLNATADPYDQTLQDKRAEFYDRFLDHCIELAENETI